MNCRVCAMTGIVLALAFAAACGSHRQSPSAGEKAPALRAGRVGIPVFDLGAGHRGPVNDLVWSPNGEQIASASTDGTVKIWVAKTGMLVGTLTGAEGGVNAVDWCASGKIVAGDASGTVLVWSPTHDGNLSNSPSPEKVLPGSAVSDLACRPGDDTAVVALENGTLDLVGFGGKLKVIEFPLSHAEDTAPMKEVAWSAAGDEVFAADA